MCLVGPARRNRQFAWEISQAEFRDTGWFWQNIGQEAVGKTRLLLLIKYNSQYEQVVSKIAERGVTCLR